MRADAGPGHRAFRPIRAAAWASRHAARQAIRRCIGFARRWVCGRLVVLDLFAFRTTEPADLRQVEEPVGPKNRAWFDRVLVDDLCVGPVVCGWGVHGAHKEQDRTASCLAGSERSECGRSPSA